VSVTQTRHTGIHLGGTREVVQLLLSNADWKLLGDGALGILGNEMVKDFYSGVKHFFKEFLKNHRPQVPKQHGVDLYVMPQSRFMSADGKAYPGHLHLTYLLVLMSEMSGRHSKTWVLAG
jgi:hypothetical protein